MSGYASNGSAPGERRGGRAKGQINRISRELMERVQQEYPGYDPIMMMVRISQDEDADVTTRLAACNAAAPYLRPKLKPIEAMVEVDEMLPQGQDLAQWSEEEILRVALRARISGDNAAAIAAHRLLADMHGTLKGGLDAKRGDLIDMTPEEQEEEILAAAEEIRRKRLAAGK